MASRCTKFFMPPDDQRVQQPRRGEAVRHHDAHELHQHDRQPRQRPHHRQQELARARGVAAQQRLLGARIEDGAVIEPERDPGVGGSGWRVSCTTLPMRDVRALELLLFRGKAGIGQPRSI